MNYSCALLIVVMWDVGCMRSGLCNVGWARLEETCLCPSLEVTPNMAVQHVYIYLGQTHSSV